MFSVICRNRYYMIQSIRVKLRKMPDISHCLIQFVVWGMEVPIFFFLEVKWHQVGKRSIANFCTNFYTAMYQEIVFLIKIRLMASHSPSIVQYFGTQINFQVWKGSIDQGHALILIWNFLYPSDELRLKVKLTNLTKILCD